MKKTITVTISPLGVPTVEAHGYQGQGCTDATQAIEKALSGSGEVTREYKDSWHESGVNQEEQHQYSW